MNNTKSTFFSSNTSNDDDSDINAFIKTVSIISVDELFSQLSLLPEFVATSKINDDAIQNNHPYAVPEDSLRLSIQSYLQLGDKALSEKGYPSAEQHYANALKMAINDQSFQLQANCFERLATVYLKKNILINAAALYNAALSLYKKILPANSNYFHFNLSINNIISIFEKLFRIEKKAAHQKNLQHPENFDSVLIEQFLKNPYLIKLERLRNEVCTKLDDGYKDEEQTKSIFQSIARNYQILLNDMVTDCIEILGQAVPCGYAIIGLGSISREEVTTYSDIEFAILIEDKKDPKINAESKCYFRQLTKLLHIKVINLGETSLLDLHIPSLGWLIESPTPKGFAFDGAGHTPLGNGTYELINTPSEMAELIKPKIFKKDRNLVNSLLHAVWLGGNNEIASKQLFKKYQKKINKALGTAKEGKLRHEYSMRFLIADTSRFEPKLGKKEETGHVIPIKYELYRLPNTILDALSLYLNLTETNTWDRIDSLSSAAVDFLSIKAAERLKNLMAKINFLRLKTYSNHKQQNEMLLFINEENSINLDKSHVFSIKKEELFELYYVLYPLLKATRTFYLNDGSINSFENNELTDLPALLDGRIYLLLNNPNQAKICLETGLKSNLNNPELAFYLAEALQTLHQNDEAIKYYEKAIAIHSSHNEKNDVASIKHTISELYLKLGKYSLAIEYAEEALHASDNSIYHLEVLAINNNLGCAYNATGNLEKAKLYFEKARIIYDEFHSNDDINRAYYYNNLADFYHNLGQLKLAHQFYLQTVLIFKRIYGLKHFYTAKALNNLASILESLGQDQEALINFEQVLNIYKQFYPLNDIHLLTISNNLAAYWLGKDAYEFSLNYFHQTLAIVVANQYSNPKFLSTLFSNIALLLNELNYIVLPEQCMATALHIERMSFGEHLSSSSCANNFHNFAHIANSQNEHALAVIFYKKALTAYDKSQPINLPLYGNTLQNLAYSLAMTKDPKNALLGLIYAEMACKVLIACLPEQHFDIQRAQSRRNELKSLTPTKDTELNFRYYYIYRQKLELKKIESLIENYNQYQADESKKLRFT